MTPIRCFRFLGNAIYVEDQAGILELVAVCPNGDQRDFLLTALTRIHNKPVYPLMPGIRVTPNSVQPA